MAVETKPTSAHPEGEMTKAPRRQVSRRRMLGFLATLGVGSGVAAWYWRQHYLRQAEEEAKHTPDLGMEMFPDAKGKALAQPTDAPVLCLKRPLWTSEITNLAKVGLMKGVRRLTVHHSGFSKEWEKVGWTETVSELRHILEFHTTPPPTGRGWGDVAYHYLIDCAGRVWQGRPLVYQGAHVQNHNEHNLGICLLGNFDLQRPPPTQLTSLTSFIAFVRQLYRIPVGEVYTHGELGTTSCPGKNLQEFMKRLRTSGV